MIDRHAVALPGQGIDVAVLRGGEGPTVVYLHGLQGVSADDPLLLALACRFHVVAPICPGFGDLADIDDIRDIHELALAYDDLLGALDLGAVPVVGHSFGGMVAAELAAHVPGRVSTLVLAAPFGMWRDDQQTADLFTAYPLGIRDLLWVDPASPAAEAAAAALARAEEPDVDDPLLAALLGMARGMTTAGKFLWPLPDRGLERRLHRIAAPTLLVWGAKDVVVPPGHAALFAARLPAARIEVLDDAGHMAPYEKVGIFVDLVAAAVD
jgi:pimeloyl-ACP methyl ester carboxylesterase